MLPWLDVVARLGMVASGETDRLSVLVGLPNWRPFLSAWATSSTFLARVGGDAALPEAEYRGNTFDQNLAWAWDVVDPFLDAALRTIDTRCHLSSAVTYQMFEIMQGAAIVLPDGSCLSIARDLAAQHARAESSALVASSVVAAWRVSRAMAAAAQPTPPPPS